jgi:hypothetical protein
MRGQPAVRAEAKVPGGHRLLPRSQDLPNLARQMVLTGNVPALGSRHHLYSAGDGVHLFGGGHRRIFAASDWLGPHDGRQSRPPSGWVHHSDRG